MRFRNINLINPSAANLNKIGTTSANAIRGIGAIKTSTVKTAESIKAIPGQVRDAPARLRAWVDKLKNPKIAEDPVVTDLLYHGHLTKLVEATAHPTVSGMGTIGTSLDDPEGYKWVGEQLVPLDRTRLDADVQRFIGIYLNNYGEPLQTHRFSVMIHEIQPYQKLTKADWEDIGLKHPLQFERTDRKNMCLFACRGASFPGRTLSTYQWTTMGAEKDYPYISTYDNIDLTFLCSSYEAMERKFFDGWMNQIIGINSHGVGYKDDFTCDIDIAMHAPTHEKTLEARLINAYPVSISAIEFAHDEGQPVEFTVTFAYDKWYYNEPKE